MENHQTSTRSPRLNVSIVDLLDCSSSSGIETVEDTDVNKIIVIVLDIYGRKINQLQAKIVVGRLPVLAGVNKIHILHLFLNLMSNALKFHRNAQPEISIEASRTGECWLFSVHDNGLGIDNNWLPKIFTLSRDFNNNNGHTGAGTGLAICKRIVETYGGNIWVRSHQGSGSTFYFTLPLCRQQYYQSLC